MTYLYNNTSLKTRRKALRLNMPKPEQILWYRLKGKGLKGYKFRRQYGVGIYALDFYCPEVRLGIEVDGDSHFNQRAEAHDENRTQFLKHQNIKVIRFTNREITENIEEVINKILEYLP